FPYSGVTTVCASRYAVTTHPSRSSPPSSPTIVGSAVATMVESSAASSIASSRPLKTTRTCRWERACWGIGCGGLGVGKGMGRERQVATSSQCPAASYQLTLLADRRQLAAGCCRSAAAHRPHQLTFHPEACPSSVPHATLPRYRTSNSFKGSRNGTDHPARHRTGDRVHRHVDVQPARLTPESLQERIRPDRRSAQAALRAHSEPGRDRQGLH